MPSSRKIRFFGLRPQNDSEAIPQNDSEAVPQNDRGGSET